MLQRCADEPFQYSEHRGKPTEGGGCCMSSLAGKLEKIDVCFWIVPSVASWRWHSPGERTGERGRVYLCVQQQNASWLVNKIAAETAEAWNLVLGTVLLGFVSLLTLPWVWWLHNEYGFDLLLPPRFGGRVRVAGSLHTHSAGLAVEAVVEFWHCALDFHLPHLLQGVSGGVELGRHVGRLVFLSWWSVGWKSSILCSVDFFQRVRTESLETMQCLFFFPAPCAQAVGISFSEDLQCVQCPGTTDEMWIAVLSHPGLSKGVCWSLFREQGCEYTQEKMSRFGAV